MTEPMQLKTAVADLHMPAVHAHPALLDVLPVAVYTTDAKGRITYCNQAAVDLAGRRPVLGQDKWCVTWRLYRPDGTFLPHDECPMAQALEAQRPIRGVEAIAERPDGGRVRILPFPTPLFGEDGQLVGAVNVLVDITEQQDPGELAARLAAIVTTSDDAIIGKTLDGVVTSWNAGATRIFGYESEEMIGQPITTIIPVELHDEERHIIAKLRRGERIEHFETVRIAKDGRRLNISLSVSPVLNNVGRLIGASKVARDITERKRAEELQRLLIGELNHRVKNTLATVQSIANQTVRRARSPSEFAASFSGRIRALARAHTLLSLNAWLGSDIVKLVEDQLLIEEIEDERVSASGPSIMLQAQLALHLALVLHELATNARKYGALSVPDGRLSVTWQVRSDPTRTLVLTWQERNGPRVQVPSTHGFGSSLIEHSLQSYGGQAHVDYAADGLRCLIVMPLPETSVTTSRIPSAPAEEYVRPAPTAGPIDELRGKRVLVVEDEPLVALDLMSMLRDLGCEPVGPARTVEQAACHIDAGDLDLALVDGNLGGHSVDDLAAALRGRSVPFAFVSGYGREGLPNAFREATLVTKPFSAAQIRDALRKLVSHKPRATVDA
jgi:PAS domain S-box-containing protein